MTFSIREALPVDAEAIYDLNTSEMGYSFPLEATQSQLIKLLNSGSDKIFVALVDSEVVGYVHANNYDLLYAPHMKNIMGIAVSRVYKRQGIGKALLEQVDHWAVETGATAVRLVSGVSRKEAHAFYRACGYSGDKQQLNLKKIL